MRALVFFFLALWIVQFLTERVRGCFALESPLRLLYVGTSFLLYRVCVSGGAFFVFSIAAPMGGVSRICSF